MSGADVIHPTERVLATYPCDRDLWLKLKGIGADMKRRGMTGDVTPLRAFQHQRYRAGRRGIAWNLTLAEWWAIWDESGRWQERGVGRGFMMCRVGDLGAYEVGNVFIGAGEENLSAACKKTDLPIGVAYASKGKKKPYRAICWVAGKQRHLGLFATVDEAQAAYLAAREADLFARAA